VKSENGIVTKEKFIEIRKGVEEAAEAGDSEKIHIFNMRTNW